MSGNDEKKNLDYNNLPKKEQENISAQKAGQTGARIAADGATGGQYEKIRKIPGVGKVAKNAEIKAGNKVGNIDKITGGNVGRVAKPLNDSGVVDTVNNGIDVVGGNPNISNSSNLSSDSIYNNNHQIVNKKPNFAKNGVNSDNSTPNGNSEGANQSRLRNIFSRKKGINNLFGFDDKSNKKSLFNKNKNNDVSDKKEGEQIADISAYFIKKIIKIVMAPFISAFFIFFLILCFILVTVSDKNGLEVVDEYENIQEENKNSTFNYSSYSFGDPKLEQFYKRVLTTKDDYNKNGKEINAMYIVATYHVINRYNDDINYDDITEQAIKDLAEGMLGNSTTYSKETYTQFLKEQFLPKIFSDSNKINEVIDEIFEYIDEYMKDAYGDDDDKKKCTTTTGSSCRYVFNGVHGLNTGKIDLSNIQVRLMSSSDCPGGRDNVVLDESLLPFEEYILGVGYGELGPNYNYEVAKVHLIAARSFALSRPYYNRGVHGVKLIQESNKNIIQLRSCVADQVFCNTKTGCSSDYDLKSCKCQPMIYSGATSHQYTYQEPLSNYPNSNLEKAWKETMGMVAIDKDGKVVLMPYEINKYREDPHDPRVWVKWAQQGMDYKHIILSAYPEIAEIKQASCNNTTENTNSGFLRVAKEIWTEITNTFGNYTNGNMVPPTTKTIDCSAYVDWVLYKYGYEDFKGYQKTTQYFYNTNLNAKYGWTEIPVAAGEDVTSKLKPGDILVRHVTDAYAHMNIIVEVRSDGSVWGYDCGSSNNWKSSKGGKLVRISTSFVKSDNRPGKIIRVTNSGTGDNCETAESGEWSEWRQNGTAPWRNISLGSGKETIGSVGCYVTSIAIQIARSGVETNIANFNPGTFVTELNKDPNSFDSKTGSLTGSGESRISTIVPGFKKEVDYVDLPNNKNEQIKAVQSYIDKGYYVVLHLDNGRHWVAVTGTTSDNIKMVDPERDNTNVYDAYPVSSVVGFSVFKIK